MNNINLSQAYLKRLKVIFLPLYHEDWASSKYRVYRQVPYLVKEGIDCSVLRPPPPKFISRFSYYARLFVGCLTHDLVFVQKKLLRAPLFFLLRRLARRLVFDFDDAIYLYKEDRPLIDRILAKVDAVVVADEELARYARRYNSLVAVIPTPVEKGNYIKKAHPPDGKVRITWVGRPWNHHYLADLAGVFERLAQEKLPIELYVVSGKPFQFPRSCFPVINVPWSEKAEEETLAMTDIGIIPLKDDEWSRGKCPYKIMLFMSRKIPVIASPVGVKAEIIKSGLNGFLAGTEDDWVACISRLVKDPNLRHKIGQEGLSTFEQSYTYEMISANLAKFLRTVVNSGRGKINDLPSSEIDKVITATGRTLSQDS